MYQRKKARIWFCVNKMRSGRSLLQIINAHSLRAARHYSIVVWCSCPTPWFNPASWCSFERDRSIGRSAVIL